MCVISFYALTAVSWAFAGLAVVLTGGRFWIRYTITKKLSWDDAAHMLALLLLLAQVGIVSGATSIMYHPADEDVSPFFRLDVAGIVTTWSCVYVVKISFLLLYRRIFQVSERFMRAWWIVLTIVIMTFWPLLAGLLTECGNPSALGHRDHCETPSAVRRQKIYVIYSCVLNVLSDLAIMALPLAMLKSLQMLTTAKIGLAAVFSCAFITIAFDILRTVETLTKDGIAGSTALWTNLESAVAVIVCCLPSFAALLNPRNRGKESPYRPRSLIVSEEAKGIVSGGSSIRSANEGGFSGAARSEKIGSDANHLRGSHPDDGYLTV